MYILSAADEIAHIDAPPLPPGAAAALASRRRHTSESGLGDMTAIIVVFASDAAAELADEMGGKIEETWIDSAKALLEGWTELVICTGNSGQATILIVEPRADDLGRLCRALTSQS